MSNYGNYGTLVNLGYQNIDINPYFRLILETGSPSGYPRAAEEAAQRTQTFQHGSSRCTKARQR